MSRSVSAVSMARSEYCSCPPRVPTPTVSQVAIASGANHTVISPRWTSARSYAGQCPTWYFVLYFGCTLDVLSRSCTCCRHDGQEVDRDSPRARDPCTNAHHRSSKGTRQITIPVASGSAAITDRGAVGGKGPPRAHRVRADDRWGPTFMHRVECLHQADLDLDRLLRLGRCGGTPPEAQRRSRRASGLGEGGGTCQRRLRS